MTTTPYEEPDDDEETPMEHFAGSLTPMHAVSKKQAEKNRRKARKFKTGFCR